MDIQWIYGTNLQFATHKSTCPIAIAVSSYDTRITKSPHAPVGQITPKKKKWESLRRQPPGQPTVSYERPLSGNQFSAFTGRKWAYVVEKRAAKKADFRQI